MLKSGFCLIISVFALSSVGIAQTLVYGEGSYFTNRPSAEHIVLGYARRRMIDNARWQCRQMGFAGEPSALGGGTCSASYANRAWSSHCESEFSCN